MVFEAIYSRADAKLINYDIILYGFVDGLNFFFGLASRGLFFLHTLQNLLSQS